MNHWEYLLVWLEVWIVTHPPPQLTHVSKANMRKCLRKFTRPQQSQSGVKARCGKHSYWLSSVLKSRLEHRRCSINIWSEFCGRLLWTGSSFAPVCLAAVIMCLCRLKQPPFWRDCPLTTHLSDILGTPSVTRFCHSNVWMRACVAYVCLAFNLCCLSCFFAVHLFCAMLFWPYT